MKVVTKWEGETVAELTVIDMQNGIAQIHQEVYKWNKSIYLQMLADFEDLKQLLKHNGIVKLVTGSEDINNKKLQKYWKMMGFLNIKTIEIENKAMLFTEMEI